METMELHLLGTFKNFGPTAVWHAVWLTAGLTISPRTGQRGPSTISTGAFRMRPGRGMETRCAKDSSARSTPCCEGAWAHYFGVRTRFLRYENKGT